MKITKRKDIGVNKPLSQNGGGHAVANQRVIGLDLLRISLAILILMFHSKSHFDCYYWILDNFARMGAIAMTAFFMLSGYSLHLVYGKAGKNDLEQVASIKKFYVKRVINIFPLYWFTALLFLIFFSKETLLQNAVLFPIEITGMQSEYDLFDVSHNGGTWFISCLAFCYFLYPFLQYLFTSLTDKKRLLLICTLVFFIFLAPVVGKMFGSRLYSNPFIRAFEFSLGLLIAQINENEVGKCKVLDSLRSKLSLVIFIILLIVGVSLAVHFGVPKNYLLYNYVALPCFIPIILSLGFLKFPKLSASKKWTNIILYLSKVSFPFFLTQIFLWPICLWLQDLLGLDGNIMRIIVSFTCCSAIAVAMHELVDNPVGNFLKHKLL